MKRTMSLLVLYALMCFCRPGWAGIQQSVANTKHHHHHGKHPVVTGVPSFTVTTTTPTSLPRSNEPTSRPRTGTPTKHPTTANPTTIQPATPPQLQWPLERKRGLKDLMQRYAVQEAVLAPGICWTQQSPQESRAFCLDNIFPASQYIVYTPAYKPNYCAPSFVCPGRIFTLEMARMALFNLQWLYNPSPFSQNTWTGLPYQIKGRVRDELIMLIANFLQLCPSDPLGACAIWDDIVVPTVRIFTLNVTDDVEYIFPNGTVVPASLRPVVAQLNGTQVPYQWREVFWTGWDSKFGLQTDRVCDETYTQNFCGVGSAQTMSQYLRLNSFRQYWSPHVQFWPNQESWPYHGQGSITEDVMESFFQVFEEEQQ